ncbi:MAG: hypothetical protein ABI699_03760 [Caldimonas sp.]
MATAKKSPGILDKMKSAVTGLFTDDDKRKSPKRVAAGKKAATTAKVTKAVTATRKAAKKVVAKTTPGANKVAKKVTGAARKASAKKAPAKKKS